MNLHISPGNRKMGAIPSFSLPSGATCSELACQTCFKDCYAHRMELRLKNVRKSYAENLLLLKRNMPKCFRELDWYFSDPDVPRRFRIHVSGDFFSLEYLKMWITLAVTNRHVHFMAFTKQWVIVEEMLADLKRRRLNWPANFTLIASAWPGTDIPPVIAENFPIAWMQDGTEDRIPEDAFLCDGDCSGVCDGHCWKMKPGQSVVFKKH